MNDVSPGNAELRQPTIEESLVMVLYELYYIESVFVNNPKLYDHVERENFSNVKPLSVVRFKVNDLPTTNDKEGALKRARYTKFYSDKLLEFLDSLQGLSNEARDYRRILIQRLIDLSDNAEEFVKKHQ